MSGEPRPRHPSDDEWNDSRRKTKPHLKVHLSVAGHPKYGWVWEDVRLRGMLVELWRIASAQGAAHTGNAVSITAPQRAYITGCSHPPARDAAFRQLLHSMGYVCGSCGGAAEALPRCCEGCCKGSAWVVVIRNLAKKQGTPPRLQRNEKRITRPPLSPLPTPLTTRTQKAEIVTEKKPKESPRGEVLGISNRAEGRAQEKNAPKGELNGGAVDLEGVLALFNEFAASHPGIARTSAVLKDFPARKREELEIKVSGHPDPEDWKTAMEWSYASNLVMRGDSQRPGPWLNPRWLISQIDPILLGTYGTGQKYTPAEEAPYHPQASRGA